MRKIVFKLVLVLSVIALSSFCHSYAFSSGYNEIIIVINVDEAEIGLGDTITASYEITGGNGDYKRIEIGWYQLIPGNDVFRLMKGTSNQTDNTITAKGEYSFTPTVAGKIKFAVIVDDTNNMSKLEQTKVIDVNGNNTSTPISISISLDKSDISLGDTITASYEITGGNGDYKRIEIGWYQLIPGNDVFRLMKGTSNQTDNTITAKGEYSFTPTVAGKIKFAVIVDDTNNMSKLGQSQIIDVNDDNPLIISISLDKGDIGLGDTIIANYEFIGGSGNFERIEIGWYQLLAENGNYIYMKGPDSSVGDIIPIKGVCSFTPTNEGLIQFCIIIYDANNMSKVAKSDIHSVSIKNEYPKDETIILPAGLEYIDEGAFINNSFSYVVIPDKVVSIGSAAFVNCSNLKVVKFLNNAVDIADDAFEEYADLLFVCPTQSSIINYAIQHHYNYAVYDN